MQTPESAFLSTDVSAFKIGYFLQKKPLFRLTVYEFQTHFPVSILGVERWFTAMAHSVLP